MCHLRSNSQTLIWPCIVSVDYLSGLALLIEDTLLITACIQLWYQTSGGPLRLGTFLAFLNSRSFINYLFFLPSTWGVVT